MCMNENESTEKQRDLELKDSLKTLLALGIMLLGLTYLTAILTGTKILISEDKANEDSENSPNY